MSNRIIAKTGVMIREGKSLAEIAKFLDPVDGIPSRHPHCVVVEAWNIAVRAAKKPQKAEQPEPPKRVARPKRARKIYRAEKRDLRWGRKPKGNTTPLERRAILAARSAGALS